MMAISAVSTLFDGLEAQKELHHQQRIQGPMLFAVRVQVTLDTWHSLTLSFLYSDGIVFFGPLPKSAL